MFFKGKKRVLKVLVLILMITLLVYGCSSKDAKSNVTPHKSESQEHDSLAEKYSMDSSTEYYGSSGFNDAQNAAEAEKFMESTSENPKSGRKIIKSANVELETKEFDKTINIITEKTNYLGGYIESSSITGRRPVSKDDFGDRVASFKLRIPEKSFDQFLLDFNDIGNITKIQRSGEDITSQYFDSEARLKSLTIQEERLLDILRKANTISEIIELERELSNVRYQIENLTGTLKKWDNLVSFSTIDVMVYEVREIQAPKPVKLGDRIIDSFIDSVKGIINLGKELLVVIASLIPILFIIAIMGLLVFYITKKFTKKRNKNIDGDEE